jgi:xylulokinase
MSNTYTLGLDISTQSISAVVVDPKASPAAIVAEMSLRYRDDERLNRFGIDFETLLVPPRVAGEADQPPEMFLAGLDAMLADLVAAGVDLSRVVAVSVSAQQHGHVYLSEAGLEAIAALGAAESDAPGGERGGERGGQRGRGPDDLVGRFRGAFAYGTAPIWQTADSQPEADELRAALGGTAAIVEASGSDSPARFTGAVMRRTARRYPGAWKETARVALLSNFFTGVLSANSECPIDWGNGAGMSLMNYRGRDWSETLVAAVGDGLPEGAEGVRRRLPDLATPITVAGTIARYFVERYGFDPGCLVNIGSGDNPQSKVMIDGDLLSLGTSFVYMVDTGEPVVDTNGYANSMYDGIGRPFVFACRTNGAMVWDRVRDRFEADYDRGERALAEAQPGAHLAVWQPYAESYPVAPPLKVVHGEGVSDSPSFEELYPAIVDSALVLTRYYAKGFERGAGPLALTGGPAGSVEIQRRVAAIFERPVVVMGSSGAALGSALSAWRTVLESDTGPGGRGNGGALVDTKGPDEELSRIRRELVPPERRVEPDPGLVESYRAATPRIVELFESAIQR